MARPGPAQGKKFEKTKNINGSSVKKEVYSSYSKKIVCGGNQRKSSAKTIRVTRKRRSSSLKNRGSRKRLSLPTPKLPPRVKLEPCEPLGKPQLRKRKKKNLYSIYYDDSDFPLKREKQDLDWEYESPEPTPDSVSLLPIIKTESDRKDIIIKSEPVCRKKRPKPRQKEEDTWPRIRDCLRVLEKEYLKSTDRRVLQPHIVMKIAKCPYAIARRAIKKFKDDREIVGTGYPDYLKPNLGIQINKNWGRSGRAFLSIRATWDSLVGANVILFDPSIKEEKGDPFLDSVGACSVISPEKNSSSFDTYFKNSFNIVIPFAEEGAPIEVELKLLKALKFSDIPFPRSTSWLLNTGSPITRIAWCPVRDHSWKKKTYLACTGDAYKMFHGFNNKDSVTESQIKEQVIQIWEFSPGTDDVPPRLAIVISHLFGFCEDLRWCPFITNYFQNSSGDKIIGIIVFAARGKLYILDVPAPKYEDRFIILEAKPRKVLESEDFFFWRVCFSQRQHQTYLFAAGTREGFITIWDFQNLSSPLKTVHSSHGSITALAFHTEDKHILAAGTRDGSLELFDMRNLFGSLVTRHMFSTPIINLHFISGTETLIVSSFYGRRHMGIKLFSMIQNAAPSFNVIYIFDLENNHPWGMDCVVVRRKEKIDLVVAISTSSGHTFLYKHPLKALFVGRKVKKEKCLYGRILHSWTIEEEKEESVRITVRGPEPSICAPNASGQGVKGFAKTLGTVTDTRVLEPGEAKDLSNMNHVIINRQLVDGTFMVASGGIAGIVHIFQAKDKLM